MPDTLLATPLQCHVLFERPLSNSILNAFRNQSSKTPFIIRRQNTNICSYCTSFCSNEVYDVLNGNKKKLSKLKKKVFYRIGSSDWPWSMLKYHFYKKSRENTTLYYIIKAPCFTLKQIFSIHNYIIFLTSVYYRLGSFSCVGCLEFEHLLGYSTSTTHDTKATKCSVGR